MEGLTSKFGFFFGKNNTWYDNGIVNIHTTLAKLGRIHTLNYTTHNNFYPGQCGQYHGSPDMSPPYLQGTPKQYIFNPDLGRTMELSLTDTNVGVHGIKGYEYKLDKSFFANSTYNRDNFCFEHGNPLPNGVFNASAVRFNAPIYMSQPHFFQADPFYSSFLEKGSLHPNQAKHETAFVYEPTSGVAMKLTARFQVNIKLDQIPEISFFKNVPKLTYFPTVWFEEHFELPKVMVNQMWWLGNLAIILICAGAFLIAFGITLFVYDLCVYHALTSKAQYENLERNNGEEGTNQSSQEQSDLIDTERGENSHDGEVGNEN